MIVDVSIIIVTYNSEEFISTCLTSIFQHQTSYLYEVIVVDNASSDNTVQIVSGFKDVRTIINDKNMGYSKANNLGIKRARGKYIMFLNPDVQVCDYFLDQLIQALQEESTRAIVAPKLIYSNGNVQASARRFPNLAVQLLSRLPISSKLISKQNDAYLLSSWNHESSREVDWAIGAALLTSTKRIKEIGLFDEDYFLYCEDLDLCYRFYKQGYKVYYHADVVLTHDYQQSSSHQISRLTLIHLKSIFIFYRKYPELIFRKLVGE